MYTLKDRENVQNVLGKANPDLRDRLPRSKGFLLKIMATKPKVISQGEYDEIKAIKVGPEKIDRLLDIIKFKPVEVYFSFMGVLQEQDVQLYNTVKSIQDEYPLHAKATGAVEDVHSEKKKKQKKRPSASSTSSDGGGESSKAKISKKASQAGGGAPSSSDQLAVPQHQAVVPPPVFEPPNQAFDGPSTSIKMEKTEATHPGVSEPYLEVLYKNDGNVVSGDVGFAGGRLELTTMNASIYFPKGSVGRGECVHASLSLCIEGDYPDMADDEICITPMIETTATIPEFNTPVIVTIPHYAGKYATQHNVKVLCHTATPGQPTANWILCGNNGKQIEINEDTIKIYTSHFSRHLGFLNGGLVNMDILAFLRPRNFCSDDNVYFVVYAVLKAYVKAVIDEESGIHGAKCSAVSSFEVKTNTDLDVRISGIIPDKEWSPLIFTGVIGKQCLQKGNLTSRLETDFTKRDSNRVPRTSKIRGIYNISQKSNTFTLNPIHFNTSFISAPSRISITPHQPVVHPQEQAVPSQEPAVLPHQPVVPSPVFEPPNQGLVSGRDIQDIVDIFCADDLDDVYTYLNKIERKDIRNASRQYAHSLKDQAKTVLNLWCDRNSEAATRDAMIRAMEQCTDCKASTDRLKSKWGYSSND